MNQQQLIINQNKALTAKQHTFTIPVVDKTTLPYSSYQSPKPGSITHGSSFSGVASIE